MKSFHQVLILTDPDHPLIQGLEQAFESHPSYKMKFIAPAKTYKTDFDESEFIMLDYDYHLRHPETTRPAFQYPDKLSIFATLSDHHQMNLILKSTAVSHLFGVSGSHSISDMKAYLLTSMENRFWSADLFLTSPEIRRSHTVFKTSAHLDDQIEKAIHPHDFSKTFEGFRAILIQILNETLTNALYNAPVDQNGQFLHRHQNRRDVIHADPQKCPTLDIIEDEEKIIISVKDYYGSLTKNVVDHFLTHGEISEKNGGAGVGIYLVLKHAHQLVINIDPGKMTEFIIVLHKFKRFFHYQTLEKSYHLNQRKKS